MNPLIDGIIFTFFSSEHYALFNTIKRNTRLTEKQQAYILSIKSSLVLFILSLYSNYKFFQSGFDFSKFHDLSDNTQRLLEQISVIFLASYLVMDTYLGNKFYHSYMTNLSGYPHHIIYTVISCICLYSGWYPLFLLYLVAELPTFILAIGSFNKRYRNDNLFGFTFLSTRILYHIFLTYKLINHTRFSVWSRFLLTSLASLILTVHLHWFRTWVKKYWYKHPNKC